MYYGILLETIRLGDKIILRPDSIVKGSLNGDFMVDEYIQYYSILNKFSQVYSEKKVIGFPISEIDLKNYYRNNGYNNYEYVDLCAGLYKDFCDQYIFVLEKDKGKVFCYAINLNDKKGKKVFLNENLLTQLSKEEVVLKIDNVDTKKISDDNDNLLNTDTIYENVTKRVIGQDDAARTLIRTIRRNLKYSSYEGVKSNILLYGPTGCGKTELIRSISDAFDVPVIIEDMTSYTASGYVGDSVLNILKRLYTASNNNMAKAEHGIIMLDEFDKLSSNDARETVNKTDVQEELLKIIEGCHYNLYDSNKTNKSLIMDTSNITFILGGAFSSFFENNKNPIGFVNDQNNMETKVMDDEDLKRYGIIPELIGRISVCIPVRKLTKEDLEHILLRSSISSLKIYEKALQEIDNVHVHYINKRILIKKIAEEAYSQNIGARGLKRIVDNIFESAIDNIDNGENCERELLLSPEVVEDNNKYILKKVKRGKNELSSGIRNCYYENTKG